MFVCAPPPLQCFIADSDDLWLRHCQRDFRRSAPEEYESWREMYLRLHDEREERLRMLTQNISSAHANKPKGRARGGGEHAVILWFISSRGSIQGLSV